MDHDNCPHCKVSLLGEPIPKEDQRVFGGATHFRRVKGIEIREFYDGIAYYECPGCKGKWGDLFEMYEKWSKKQKQQ